MKYLDEKLINARPNSEADNEQFVHQTISAVQNTHHRETFESVLRTDGVSKNKENFMTKLLAMPKIASITLGMSAVLLTGGIAYAAINWFGADVSTKQQADVVYSVAAECSPSTVQALRDNKPYTNTSQYKILKPELISQEDLKLDELSTCEQRAIETSLRSSMPNIYQAGDSKNGLYYPVGKYGTVVNVTGNEITVSQLPVDHESGPRELITATLKIGKDTLVMDKGKATELASFKQGDPVYIIVQNPVRNDQNDHDWRATPSDKSVVRSVTKTQYDMKTIKEKVFKASAEGAFQIIEKSDGFGG
ncbi:MAG: hypothetical protein ABWX94_03070 [Candidatus Saccharimonadales bacterium]